MATGDEIMGLLRAALNCDLDRVGAAARGIAAHSGGTLSTRILKVLEAQAQSAPMRSIISPVASRTPLPASLVAPAANRRLLDLDLPERVRLSVSELIEEQRRRELLSEHGLRPRNRVLLVGPPGNGKTSLAEAIACELEAPFFLVDYAMLFKSYLGETGARLKEVFDFAVRSPCVLFFDECECVASERGDGGDSSASKEINRVVSSLLVRMDGLPDHVVLVAATNHSAQLDVASWRRFDLCLELPRPTPAQLSGFLSRLLRGGVGAERCAEIASGMDGASYADAEMLCLDVRRRSVLSGLPLDGLVVDRLAVWRGRSRPSGVGSGSSGGASSMDRPLSLPMDCPFSSKGTSPVFS